MTRALDMSFRTATVQDAGALARFQVRAWRENYRDFLPRGTLDAVSVEDRTEAWRMILGNPSKHGDTEAVLAVTSRGLAGFGAAGRQRDPTLGRMGFGGEISAIYVDRDEQGHGLGRRMLARLFGTLSRLGERRASLWVIRDNKKARGFAEATGGELLDVGSGGRHHALDEVAYGWRRLELSSGSLPVVDEHRGTGGAGLGRIPSRLVRHRVTRSERTVKR